jgi:hypothetical protein
MKPSSVYRSRHATNSEIDRSTPPQISITGFRASSSLSPLFYYAVVNCMEPKANHKQALPVGMFYGISLQNLLMTNINCLQMTFCAPGNSGSACNGRLCISIENIETKVGEEPRGYQRNRRVSVLS